MSDAPDDKLIEMLLAGTPARVVDGLAGTTPAARSEIDTLREALGALGLALDPMPIDPSARARFAAALASAPAPSRREALVVMDMLVDHLTPGAALEVPRARDIVPQMKRRIEDARAAGTPVIYLVDHHEPGDPELEVWGAHNTGEPIDEIWPPLRPAPTDVIVPHRAYSGFFETKLDDVLRSRGVNTVVLTGCLTEMHLFATAVDALQRGFKVEVPPSLQAGSSALAEQVALTTLSVMAPVQPHSDRRAP